MSRTAKFSSLLALPIMLMCVSVPFSSYADGSKLAAECADCHGKDGVSADDDIPTIAGFSEKYIVDSMNNYKKKARPCPKEEYQTGSKKGQKSDMCTIAAKISDADVKELAKLFAAKKFVPAKQKFDAALAAKGKKLHEKRCEKCHTEGGKLPDDDNGILAGQWMTYLNQSIKEFTGGKRPVPKKMKPKIEGLTPADFEALVHYYGSQQ